MARVKMRLTLVLVAAIATGCIGGGRGSVERARQMASEYLAALTGDAADRGWSLILPDSRRAYADAEQYGELATEADWSRFNWQLVGDGSCEDGGVYCVVRLQIDDAPGSIPAFLQDPPGSREDDLFMTFRLDDDDATPGNAEITVYFDPDGTSGILLGGG